MNTIFWSKLWPLLVRRTEPKVWVAPSLWKRNDFPIFVISYKQIQSPVFIMTWNVSKKSINLWQFSQIGVKSIPDSRVFCWVHQKWLRFERWRTDSEEYVSSLWIQPKHTFLEWLSIDLQLKWFFIKIMTYFMRNCFVFISVICLSRVLCFHLNHCFLLCFQSIDS